MTTLAEVSKNAKVAAEALRSSKHWSVTDSIKDVCGRFDRAWSGSNIGYHASVYYQDFEVPPAGAHFSAEWGLMDALSVRDTRGAWAEYRHEDVCELILSQIDVKALEALEAAAEPFFEEFADLKETAISLLLSALDDRQDDFLQSKLKDVRELEAHSARTIEGAMLPRGQYVSRDRVAMGGGIRSAPHQTVQARGAAVMLLESRLKELAVISTRAEGHLDRRRPIAGKQGDAIFVGHGRSQDWRELRDFVEKRLKLPVDEFNSVPIAGVATTVRLAELLNKARFAFLVMTAEDEQADGKQHARLNVIHEVGLFQGRLGFSHAIVLLEDGCEEFSNIHGLGQIRFKKGDIAGCFETVRAVLERENVI